MKTKNLNGHQNIVGSNIKKYRELKGLSQRELADKVALLGVTLYNSDISHIENHTYNPPHKHTHTREKQTNKQQNPIRP